MGRNRESDPKTGKPVVSSAGKFWGMNTIYGRDGEHGTPYMTRVWVWGLRLHIFHRPDLDEDCHDHPWDFTTIPLWPIHGYVEEVVNPELTRRLQNTDQVGEGWDDHRMRELQVVPAFRPSFRPATHCHRVLGAFENVYTHPTWGDLPRKQFAGKPGPGYAPAVNPNRKIVTLVWRGEAGRGWGFLKNRDGKWCWVAWRDYVFAGGKDGPCQ